MKKQNINVSEVNSKIWDIWVDEGDAWSIPISHETFIKAQSGIWEVHLTPCKPVPKDWFIPIKGAKILGLASGGGQQCPIFSALGADITVLDYSTKQLEQEQKVADREDYSIKLIKGEMTDLSCFEDETFDLVFNPVSNCYVRDVLPVWREAYRVLKKGGVLLSGFGNPMVYLFNDGNGEFGMTVKTKIPYDPIADCNEQEIDKLISGGEGLLFSHSLETLLGGQMRVGFRMLDLYEDYHNEGELAKYTPTYIATKAIKD